MGTRRSPYARLGLDLLAGCVVLAVSFLGWAPAARGQTSSLEERLLSKDPAVSGPAVKGVLAEANRTKPLLLVLAAARLFESGSRDDAVFWNFAGMVRAGYAPPDERAQHNGQLMGWLGVPINAYAMRDSQKTFDAMKKAMDWDTRTYATWARANNLDPTSAALTERRKRARENMVEFVNKMKASAPPQPKESGEVRIKREYTTNPVERVVDGTTLRIPANYVTPFGLSAPARETVAYVALVIFFPNLEGYTPTNWRDVETSKDAVFVVIKRDSGGRNASTAVPCDAKTVSQRAGGRCEVVVVDPSSGLQIQGHFLPDDGARAQKLEARLGQLLKAWLVK
jgi:hypothetical protein